MHNSPRYRAGVDIGGTFTDLIIFDDATGALVIGKTLTTPADPSQAIEAGLADPTDASRRTAFAAAEAIGLGTPVGCLGLAVFLSGGSMAPASAPEVPAPPGLAGRSITGALMMSAVSQDPQNAPKKVRLFAESGAAVLVELSSAKSPVDAKSPQPQF